jgi:hypothetical protein
MDRRTFLAGLGTAAAGATAGWATLDSRKAATRAASLARAAGAPGAFASRARAATAAAAQAPGLAIASVAAPLSQTVERVANGEVLRWSPWSAGAASALARAQTAPLAVQVYALRVAAAPLVRSLDVIAHFALEDGSVAPFYASSYRAAAPGRPALASPAVAFDAPTPDHMALQVDYALDAATGGAAQNGSVYLPIGSLDGAGPGLYVLAAPSRATGTLPSLASYRFTGDLHAPLADAAGEAPDFDHLVVTIEAA